MREYYHIVVRRKDGSTYDNPLKLSELHILREILKNNVTVSVLRGQMTKEQYKATFGV